MTSINALKFNASSGVMVCDEQRGWNDDRLKVYCSDKILPVLAPELTQRYQLGAAYGNTGSSTIGDEIRQTLQRTLSQKYQKQVEQLGRPPETFLTLDDIAQLTFKIICDLKRDHVDENLKHAFGFTTQELISGQYERNGTSFSLETPEIIDEALKRIGPASDPLKNNVLNNAGILAGYDSVKGFQIFMYSMREQYYEPIYCGFACLGSGSDSANAVMANFFNQRSVAEREHLNPVIALKQLLTAVSTASRVNLGVGGYFNIILFQGGSKGCQVKEINDHRSKLALEMVEAGNAGFFSEADVCTLLDGLLFQEKDEAWGEHFFWTQTRHSQKLHWFLREYPEAVWKMNS